MCVCMCLLHKCCYLNYILSSIKLENYAVHSSLRENTIQYSNYGEP